MTTWWGRVARKGTLVGATAMVLAGGAGVLTAQEARPAAAEAKAKAGPQTAEQAAARELVRLVTPKETYEQMLAQMLAAMLQSMKAQTKDLPPDFEQKMQLVMRDVMPYDDLLEWTVELYAKRFSASELKQMTAFYRTPVGQKCIRLMPEISAEVGGRIGTILPAKVPEAMRKHGLM